MLHRSCCIIIIFLILSVNCHGNSANEFDIRDEHHRVKKYVAAVLFGLFLLYSITTNLLMAVIFCRRRDNLNSRPFVLITYQLMICSFLSFIPQVTIVLFEMLNTKSSSDSRMKTWIYSMFVTINTFSFTGTLHFAFLLTVNRFAAVNSPNFNAFFESVKFYFLIAFVWLSVLVLSLAEFFFCTKTFVTSNLRWSVNCTKKTYESGETFLKIRYVWTLALPITMFAIYISIFYNTRRKLRNSLDQCSTNRHQTTNEKRSNKYERLMLIQGAMVCAAIEIEIFCFCFLSQIALKVAGKEADIAINIFVNCYVILNNAVLPTANLIFVKRFRDEIKTAILKLLSKTFKVKLVNALAPGTIISTKVQPIFHAERNSRTQVTTRAQPISRVKPTSRAC
ncbi:7 transmembrane receptor (rhodopsin family) protein [Acanthocheilonema viteae]